MSAHSTLSAGTKSASALVRLPSGRVLNLLDPHPASWTDEDLALGLSRTLRWGGHSRWPLPLSVAQHSLATLAIRRAMADAPAPSRTEARRELLHDAVEGLLGWDPISPLKPFLGPAFAAIEERLQRAVDERYELPPATPEERRRHRHADQQAAANEALHVAGWSMSEIRDRLGIHLPPVAKDPLDPPAPFAAWEP